jgi:hypothetical protein
LCSGPSITILGMFVKLIGNGNRTRRYKLSSKLKRLGMHSPFLADFSFLISFSTSKLAPPLSETELIQSLVLQFLTHDGYVETARAFADEIHSEKQALNLNPSAVIPGFDVKEDEDAGHRQRKMSSRCLT